MKKGVRKQGICLHCGKNYYKYKKKSKYCSRKCFSQIRKIEVDDSYKEILRKRIIEKSCKCEKTDCWNWIKYKNKDGRAQCYFIGNKTLNASRVSYIAFKGNIPEGLLVCHICDNPSCVNPEHLFIGTNKDNADDKVNKNRSACGEKISTKLKNEMILEIRELSKNGMTQQNIAKKYNVCQTTIGSIILRKTWKHI